LHDVTMKITDNQVIVLKTRLKHIRFIGYNFKFIIG